MLDKQLTLDVSSYSNLYDILVPKTHFLRQLTELCDFSFIYDELEKDYRLDFGRKAYSPIMIFKYLLYKLQEDSLESELAYTEELMAVVENHEKPLVLPAVSQKFNYLKEAVDDDLEHLEASVKEEVRVGHKTADSSF